MGLAFATRAASAAEIKLLSLLLSTFRDGSGNERELDGSTRANWRQMERCVAELLDSKGGEDKGIFDVIAKDDEGQKHFYGFSVKSKQLPRRQFEALAVDQRVYMEIANSPAKMWAELERLHGIDESDFRAQRHAHKVGESILQLVERWHAEGKREFERTNPGSVLDLDNSCYLCISYSQDKPDEREYVVHSFPLAYPRGISWFYKSASCLTGYDPAQPEKALIDWYGVSGGQLKYYPMGITARFACEPFKLRPVAGSHKLLDKCKLLFPEDFAGR